MKHCIICIHNTWREIPTFYAMPFYAALTKQDIQRVFISI